MLITNGIITSCILGMISAVDQHEEMRCKARSGCHLAKCDPGLLSPSLNANEYPVTCVRTSAQDGGEYNELKSEMRILRTAFELLNYKKTKMDENVAALSEDFTSYASRISTLENENKKTTAEMEALKTKLSRSEQSNEVLLKDSTSYSSRISTLENKIRKTTSDFTSYASRISTLENENKKTTAEMEALKTKLLKSEQSYKVLLNELNALRIKTNDLESHLAKPKTALVRSCDGVQLESAIARNDSGGVFKLDVPEIGIKNVFCDVTDDGGDWTVFQRRMNGDVDFYRGWDDYVKGFGDLQGDHWLGLETLHQLTKDGEMELKIEMISRIGSYSVARFSSFRIGPGSDNYTLHVSGYSGNATGDALSPHNNQPFSTKDADHDVSSSWNCASYFEGGWWYRQCAISNLNGNFNKTDLKGIWWGDDDDDQMSFSEMKLRKRS